MADTPPWSVDDTAPWQVDDTQAPSTLSTLNGYAGAINRGAAEGITSLVTAPADAGIAAINYLKRHPEAAAMIPGVGGTLASLVANSGSTLDTNLGDLVIGGLDRLFGRPQTRGQQAVHQVASLASGGAAALPESLANGASNTPTTIADIAKNPDNIWQSNPANSLINKAIVNKSWGDSIGENVTKITDHVVARAQKRIKGFLDLFESPTKSYSLDAGDIEGELKALNQAYTPGDNALLNSHAVRTLSEKLQQNAVRTPAAGDLGFTTDFGMRSPASRQYTSVSGQELGSAASELQKRGKAAADAGRWEEAQAFFKAQDKVQDTLFSGMTPAEQQIYQQARSQYRHLNNFILGDDGVVGNVNLQTGDINAMSIARYLRRIDPNGYSFRGNLSPAYNTARFGELKQGSNISLADMTRAAAQQTTANSLISAAAAKAGVSAQWIAQIGAPNALKLLSRNKTFMEALSAEMANSGIEEQQ